MKIIVLALTLLVLYPMSSSAETHPAVQAALDYEIPTHQCGDPIVLPGDTEVTAQQNSAGQASFFEGSSTASVSDTDHYSRKRLERKGKRQKKCVAKYKKGLLSDMETLKGSASHGLTQEQANTILGHIKLIQEVYMSPNGVLVADSESQQGSSDSES